VDGVERQGEKYTISHSKWERPGTVGVRSSKEGRKRKIELLGEKQEARMLSPVRESA